MRRNSRSATVFPACATSVSIAASVASSFSERASWNSSRASRSWPSRPARTRTMFSSCFFSRPSSWARLGSDQTSGFSSSLATSARRACLPSKSKIPPQLLRPRVQAGERRGDLIDAFGFHDGFARETRIIEEVSSKGVMPPCVSPAVIAPVSPRCPCCVHPSPCFAKRLAFAARWRGARSSPSPEKKSGPTWCQPAARENVIEARQYKCQTIRLGWSSDGRRRTAGLCR